MTLKAVDNLKGFAYHRPPLIIFLVCLLLFAIALISLGIYIQNHNIEDYETEDWNKFLLDFSRQQFCINESIVVSPPATPILLNSTVVPTTNEAVTESNSFEISDIVGTKNVSFAIKLDFYLAGDGSLRELVGLSSLSCCIAAKQLKLDEDYGDVDMTFDLQYSIPENFCKDESCNPSKEIEACLTIAVPKVALPHISKAMHPEVCNKSIPRTTLSGSEMYPKLDENQQDFCTSGVIVNPAFRYNPHLTIMLSEEQKSIINLHLMYTSYFLFVMLITCVFYALIKGPPVKQRILLHDNGVNNKKQLPQV